ncbi:MAG TPA: cysteine desulfurase family protein [Vicinamibacterales bacterium]|nr:cysteine desulfurase family protein [Vicinamibacterales bacterium]
MRIYLDHNATTPVDPAAAAAMTDALGTLFGNASSLHYYGQQAKAAIDGARSAVAALIGAEPSEVIFTSGGTESDNFAIRGAAEALEATGRTHVITVGIEHEAVINSYKALARRGWKTTMLALDASGIVSPNNLREAMTDDTALVSIMHANNEIGTIQPIAELAQIAHARGALFHTDAVQSAGKIPVSVRALGVDLLSISGHKFYGPKGVGALWVKRGVRLSPFLAGGKQERNRRAGTENVPGVIGMGVAAAHALQNMESEAVRLAALRNRLETGILSSVPNTEVNGTREPRVPNTSNISFDRVEAESLLIALDLEGVAVSTGSACSSGTLEPSHVLKAMGLSSHRAQNSIRFSLGAANTEDEIDRVVTMLPKIVTKLRSLSSVGARG